MKRLAKFTAIELPIAVPLIWWINLPLKNIVLQLRIILIKFEMILVGIEGINRRLRKDSQAILPSSWSMLV